MQYKLVHIYQLAQQLLVILGQVWEGVKVTNI